MLIYYKDIEEDILPLETDFTVEEDEDKISLSFKGELIVGTGTYALRGSLDVLLVCPCDRCGEEARIVSSQDIIVGVLPQKNHENAVEYEMTDAEGEEYNTNPEYMDLHDILRQEALLLLPVKRLCQRACTIETYEDADETTGLAALKKLLKEK